MKDCLVCELMESCGLFSKQEIKDYHNSKLNINSFDKRQREELYSILAEAEEA